MKSVTFDPRLPPGMKKLAEEATTILDQVVRRHADLVSAEWSFRVDDKGRELVALRIWDWAGEASTELAQRELSDPTSLRVRLYLLWGDLLQAQFTKQLQNLEEPVGPGR